MSSGRRAVALRPGQLLAVGGMLFSMFFGAGNLILPPLLGLQAGDQAIPAMTGFLIAGIGLPVLGIVAVAVCGGVRELAGRESERRSREEEQMRFIAEDAREFARRYPEADLAGLDASESFRRFCGSRYGREPLSELYADYLEVAGGALRAAQARRESRAARSTGSGGSGAYEALNARQQSELDAWNRAFPQMKMSAREYLSRNK